MISRDPKVCLITGATSGIGKAAAISLARQGFKLVLVGRAQEKSEKVRQGIKEVLPNSTPEVYIGDLSSRQSIGALAKDIRSAHPRIDVLINNAGGIFGSRVLTAEGIEYTFALNHLGYFSLTNRLLDTLQAAGDARIVNVSSQVHKFSKIDLGDLSSSGGYNAMKAYAQSKLANLLFTYELSRRLAGTKITVNALHPGGVRTNFGRELPGLAGIFFRHFGLFLRSPEKGAETLIWLASSDQVAGVTGKYFLDKREIRSSNISYDLALAKQLWDVSSKLTALD
ncbi:MAG TPA: short-chain dehydrogenase [Bacteroidetes bacterium]|nr:short-chain dehydrogenase [Bacteroidota bacterium]